MWKQSDDVALASGRMSNSSRGRLVGAPELFRTWTLIGRPSPETRECCLRCQGRLRLPITAGVHRPGPLEPLPLLRRRLPTHLELRLLEATPGVLAGSSVLASGHGGGGWTQANQLRVRQGVRLLLDDPRSELVGGDVGGWDCQRRLARAALPESTPLKSRPRVARRSCSGRRPGK